MRNSKQDFPRPISDFSERYDEDARSAEFSAWHARRKWQVMEWILAVLIGVPIAYVAFCAMLALGDVF